MYPPEERIGIRCNNSNWNKELYKYLYNLACPIKESYCEENKIKILLWITSYAISIEYEDKADLYNNVIPNKENIMKKIEINRETIHSICNLLNINYSEDIDLLSIITQIKNELKSRYPNGFPINSNQNESQIIEWNYKQYPLGFNTNNEMLNKCCVVMKLLYLEDIKQFQNGSNKLIAMVQEYTANPITNTNSVQIGK
ncbi:hypothetical protein WA158_003994 [Blastocystis sp. Blastoise]